MAAIIFTAAFASVLDATRRPIKGTRASGWSKALVYRGHGWPGRMLAEGLMSASIRNFSAMHFCLIPTYRHVTDRRG